MTTATTAWFDAVAAIPASVDGIEAVHGAGREADPESAVVQPMVDSIEAQISAFLGHQGIDPLTHGPWQRQTHNLVLNIWLQRNPIQAQYAKAIDLIDPVMEAFEAHAKGFAVETRLQSVVLKSFEGITAREWPPQSSRWFLVLPWRVEAQVNRAATYIAA